MEDTNGREHLPPGKNGGQFAPKNRSSLESAKKEEIAFNWTNGAEGKKKSNNKKIHIDFNQDNILPELNKDDLEKIGSKTNKKVLLKKSSIERNNKEHNDILPEDTDRIIGETLYDADDVIPGKNASGNYHSFVKLMDRVDKKGNRMFGVVLLDVNETNEYFEIVHWHWVRKKSIKSI